MQRCECLLGLSDIWKKRSCVETDMEEDTGCGMSAEAVQHVFLT